jgi:ubiquinone/menaquinone biosynthesis C-methylase UbiE
MKQTTRNGAAAFGNSATMPASVTMPRMRGYPPQDPSESLFEHVSWLYIFCREKLFRDDTDRIITALWPDGSPRAGDKMIELGCGPGFYSCRFAKRFCQLSVVGVDRSERQLAWARERAKEAALENCQFERVNVLDIPCSDTTFNTLIASRLFTVLAEREKAIAEIYRVLTAGGRCFVAEPRSAFRASVPLLAMWLLARITRLENGYREPRKAVVMSGDDFRGLFATQPWKYFECWQDDRYQYALCEKG